MSLYYNKPVKINRPCIGTFVYFTLISQHVLGAIQNLHKYLQLFVGHDYTMLYSHLDIIIRIFLIILTLACVNKSSSSSPHINVLEYCITNLDKVLILNTTGDIT